MLEPHHRRTLRDQLLDAEQSRSVITVDIADKAHRGTVRDVGVDYVTIMTGDGMVDCALFHVRAVEWDQAAG